VRQISYWKAIPERSVEGQASRTDARYLYTNWMFVDNDEHLEQTLLSDVIGGYEFICETSDVVERPGVRARNEAKLRRGASLRFVWDEARRSEARFLESRTRRSEARQKLDEAKRSDLKSAASTFLVSFFLLGET
jgi:hypothetical protein